MEVGQGSSLRLTEAYESEEKMLQGSGSRALWLKTVFYTRKKSTDGKNSQELVS